MTLDAIHCQTETVKTIVDKGAGYILPEFGDQSTVTRRYFISSLTSDAELLLQTARGHRGCCHGGRPRPVLIDP